MKLDTQTVCALLVEIMRHNDKAGGDYKSSISHVIVIAAELERQVEAHNREQEPASLAPKKSITEPALPEWTPNSGVERISMERARQILVGGWTTAHDDEHDEGELAQAARCYADPNITSRSPRRIDWPWNQAFYKPSDDPIKNLVRAGALIAAEIDRLLRIKAKQPHLSPPTKCYP